MKTSVRLSRATRSSSPWRGRAFRSTAPPPAFAGPTAARCSPRLPRLAMAGELALDGSVRPIPGVLAIAEAAREQGAEAVIVPAENGSEAALVDGVEVLVLDSLAQVPELASGERVPDRPQPLCLPSAPQSDAPDLADLRGQPHLRYALEVAASP